MLTLFKRNDESENVSKNRTAADRKSEVVVVIQALLTLQIRFLIPEQNEVLGFPSHG